jgi:FkbM family methyltransferase
MEISAAYRLIGRLPASWQERCAALLGKSAVLNGIHRRITSSLKHRDGIVANGPAHGLRFNPGRSDSRFLLGTFELPVQHILGHYLRPGMVLYDVGANAGFFAIVGADLVGPAGQVHCFEPLPENADLIHHNARLNGFGQISIHPVALAQIDSTAVFRVSERPTFGALIGSSIGVDKQIATIDVPVRRLDSVFNERGLRGPNAIKVDIEGSEVDFLAGAENVIRRFRPLLIIELHGTNAAVSARLKTLAYDADVVGEGSIEQAGWAAIAVATPREMPETRAAIARLSRGFRGR